MNDLILFTPSKGVPYEQIGRYIECFIKTWIEDIAQQMPIFKTSLQYMGNEIFIEIKKVCVKPLRNRLEAIQKLQPTKDTQGM